MGQYYKPVSIEKEEFLYSHDYSNGSKLMEHSYIGNNFVGAVENLLMPGGAWRGDRIVWAGDYADAILDENGDPLKDEDGYEVNLYRILEDDKKIKPKKTKVNKDFHFVVNHTKKQYVDKRDANGVSWDEDDEMRIHPLPLLTADGNGRGGGDYHGESKFIGIWKGDQITIDKEIPDGYKKIVVDFKE